MLVSSMHSPQVGHGISIPPSPTFPHGLIPLERVEETTPNPNPRSQGLEPIWQRSREVGYCGIVVLPRNNSSIGNLLSDFLL